ncbi:hypothetical protein [Halorhabdus salina]|uniref:hypothetical protein n=1 Tax=Halorhabdus salina TaxID=2750670 RepID=UPI0015EF1E96|nr:hypothetical protein [Halorhabdus salina]
MNSEPLSDQPNRRALLASIGALGSCALAGCSGDGGGEPSETAPNTSEMTETATETTTETATETTTETATETATEMPAGHDHYVANDGSDDDPGTRDAPLATIAAAVEGVTAGESIYVQSGEYQEYLQVRASGTTDQPIEITGPADAVLRRQADRNVAMIIGGNHVHVTGLSITGVSDPSRRTDPEAYADAPLVLVTALPPFDEYNRGAVIAPHRIGYSGAQLVKFRLCREAEAGPFRVSGRAGAAWQLTESGHPSGEIVYVGTSPSTIEKTAQLNKWDNTRNVRVHHVDNSAGHPHNQLVDIKPGTENITVEYCTDGGGSHNNKDWAARSIAVRGHAATVRWNRLQDGVDTGIGLGSSHNNDPENDLQKRAGEDNEIYGNEIIGFGGNAIAFPWTSDGPGQAPEDQAILCGNEFDGPVDGNPGQECSPDIPEADEIGHVGGDSPWAEESLPESTGPDEADRDDDGTPPPEFSISGTLETETVTVGDRATILATVGNSGGEGSIDVTVEADGTVGGEELVQVPADSKVTTEVKTGPVPQSGTYMITLNGQEVGELTAEPDDE